MTRRHKTGHQRTTQKGVNPAPDVGLRRRGELCGYVVEGRPRAAAEKPAVEIDAAAS